MAEFTNILFKKNLNASPDFGYSTFNNRDEDLKSLVWSDRKYSGSKFAINATKRDNHFAGSIIIAPDGDKRVYVASLEIADEWRGTGLGQMLYDKAIAYAKKMGVERVYAGGRSPDAVRAWQRLAKRYPVLQDGERPYIDLTQTKKFATPHDQETLPDGPVGFFEPVENSHSVQPLRASVEEKTAAVADISEQQEVLLKKMQENRKLIRENVSSPDFNKDNPAKLEETARLYQEIAEFENELDDLWREYKKANPPVEPEPKAPTPSPNTPAFKTWFNGSQVVDAEGNPLRAYHGSTKDFDEFNTSPKEDKDKAERNPDWAGAMGSWFTTESLHQGNYDEGNAEFVAESFTQGDNWDDYRPGAHVKPVWLSIKNPAQFEDYEHFQEDRIQYRSWKEFRKHIEAEGHDGVVIRNSMTDGNADRDDWIAFYPNQIKSAIGNSGEFNPKDSRVTAATIKTAIVSLDDVNVDKGLTFNRLEKAWKREQRLGRPQTALGKFGAYDVLAYGINDEPIFAIYDPKTKMNVGYAIFIQHAVGIYETDRLAFSPEYQGLGLGAKFYSWLINGGVAKSIMSGNTQTRGGRSTWKKLARIPGIFVYGWDKKTNQAFSLAPNDLSAEEEIWSADKMDEDTGEPLPVDVDSFKLVLVAIKGSKSKNGHKEAVFNMMENPAFKAWFSGSKVVNPDGSPMVMYHSTQADIGDFRPFTHFGTQAAANQRYDDTTSFYNEVLNNPNRSKGSNIMPVYLAISNPLRLPDLASIDLEGNVLADGYDNDNENAPYPRGWESEDALAMTLLEQGVFDIDEYESTYTNDKAAKLLQEKGYDGIVYKNSVEDAGNDSWIAFRPDQVKSALGNGGNFDAKNPSIVASKEAASNSGYTSYVLSEASHSALLAKFPPKFPNVFAHHVTYQFGVPSDTPAPPPAKIEVVGYASDKSLECVVVAVNGTTKRGDGGTYHITLSLDKAAGRKPQDSNKVLDNGWEMIPTFEVEAEPQMSAHKTAFVNNDMVYLKDYLTMSDRDKGEELARNFEYKFKEYLEDTDEALFAKLYPDGGEDEYLDDYTQVPDDVLVNFESEMGSELMQENPADCPSFMHMRFEKIVQNQWLLHKTDDPYGICRSGFTIGMDDLTRLGLTSWHSDKSKRGGYNFAFLASDARLAEGKYGSEAVIFRASGVLVYHYGDEERQVIFRGDQAHDLIPVFHRGDNYEWYLSDDDHGKPVFGANTLAEVVNWVETHFEQYRRVIVKRASLSGSKTAGLSSVTESSAFKAWFGDSKIVDPYGDPLPVFHGTGFNFDSFTYSSRPGGLYFFAVNPKLAEEFAGDGAETAACVGEVPAVIVMPCYLKVDKPFDTRNPEHAEFLRKWGVTTPADELGNYEDYENETVLAEIKKKGFDGIWMSESSQHDTIAVFSSRQIKSVTGNNGNFDPKDIRITASTKTSSTKTVRAYHGTTAKFDSFNTPAMFHVKKKYAEDIIAGKDDGRIIEAILTIKNPADLEALHVSPSDPNFKMIAEELEAEGYDGAQYKQEAWIAFHPEQIRIVQPKTADTVSKWLVWEDAIPSDRGEAQLKKRKEMDGEEYEFRLIPSPFHADGSMAIEGKKKPKLASKYPTPEGITFTTKGSVRWGYLIKAVTDDRLYAGDDGSMGRIILTPYHHENEPDKEIAFFIGDVKVEEEFRDQGVGLLLYKKAIALAKNKGAVRLYQGVPQTQQAAIIWTRLAKEYPVKTNEEGSKFIDLLEIPSSVTASSVSSDTLTVYHVSKDKDFTLDPNHQPKSGGIGEFYVSLQPDVWKATFEDREHVHAFKIPKDVIAHSPQDYPSMKELNKWAIEQGYMSMQEVHKPSGELVTESDNVTPMVRPEVTDKAKKLPFYGQKDPMRGGGLRFLEVAYLKAHGFSAVESLYSPDGHEIAVFDTSCLIPIKTAAASVTIKARDLRVGDKIPFPITRVYREGGEIVAIGKKLGQVFRFDLDDDVKVNRTTKAAKTELIPWDGDGKIEPFVGYEPGGRLSKIIQVPLKSLIPTESSLSEESVGDLVNALRYDDGKPIPALVVESAGNKKYYVLDGHHRLDAAKRVGYKMVPVRVWTSPDDLDNKMARTPIPAKKVEPHTLAIIAEKAREATIGFRPAQSGEIKSAIGNSGKFDKKNPSVTASETLPKSLATKAEQIVALINNDDTPGRNVWGIRAIHHQNPVKVGDTLGVSYRWDDGNPTDDELEGVCAIQCTSFDQPAELSMVERALNLIAGYPCDQLVLLASSWCVGGEDRGEIIMRDAVVVALLDIPRIKVGSSGNLYHGTTVSNAYFIAEGGIQPQMEDGVFATPSLNEAKDWARRAVRFATEDGDQKLNEGEEYAVVVIDGAKSGLSEGESGYYQGAFVSPDAIKRIDIYSGNPGVLVETQSVKMGSSSPSFALYIEVPASARDHFWAPVKEGQWEFWAFRSRPHALKGEKIIFRFDGKPVAEAVVEKIEKPGESSCSSTGRFERHYKIFWRPETFKKYKTAASKPFPNSKIKQMVYHGTREPFTRVDMSHGAQGLFWVASDKASIENGEAGANSSKCILGCYINVQNPAGWAEYEKKSIGELKRDGFDSVVLPDSDGTFNVILFKPSQVRIVGDVKTASERTSTIEALQRLDKIPQTKPKVIDNPLHVLPQEPFAVEELWRHQHDQAQNAVDTAAVESIEPKFLCCSQDFVDVEMVRYYIEHPTTSEKPIVYRLPEPEDGFEYYLIDGNHRAVAALLRGEQLQVRLITLA